jgi:hypothetical protein
MLRAIVVSLVVAAQVSIAWAQQPLQQVTSPSSQVQDLTIQDVQASIAELSKRKIPDKDILLVRELDRVDGEIARATLQLQKANSWKNAQQRYNDLAERLKRNFGALPKIDCDKDSGTISAAVQAYLIALGDFLNYTQELGDWDKAPLYYIPSAKDPVALCTAAKTHFSSPESTARLNQLFDDTQKALAQFLTLQTNLAVEGTKYLEDLKQYRQSVQEKLNASQPASQIGGSLPLLLGILALACVATILGIKLFDAELQMEWVASGQVIQFVTVMILLSVIFALGLSLRLQENTLGTLLGGIAGYVLAQGVGRSAARDVVRSKVPGPPPAAPPPAAPPPAAPPPAAPPPAPSANSPV